ncbi:phage tail terminator protein [Salinibacillus xinjiangensis]|nr:minor capsid protein [Salinibacillus xinjiangensis]
MDFLDRLKEHIEGLSFTPSTVGIGMYQEDGNSVAIRPSPANPNERYMNKGKIYPFSFQILVHHQENVTAYDTIEKINSNLDNLVPGAITSSDGSFNLVTMQCTTTPNYVQKTSYGVLWTALFEAELDMKE